MFSQTTIISLLAILATVSATPIAIETRTTPADASCATSPKINQLYKAILPKNYLYQIACDTKTTGTVVSQTRTNDVWDCTTLCDGWTSAGKGKCQAATFQTGTASGTNNCFMMGPDGLAYSSVTGWETLTVTATHL